MKRTKYENSLRLCHRLPSTSKLRHGEIFGHGYRKVITLCGVGTLVVQELAFILIICWLLRGWRTTSKGEKSLTIVYTWILLGSLFVAHADLTSEFTKVSLHGATFRRTVMPQDPGRYFNSKHFLFSPVLLEPRGVLLVFVN